MSVCCSNARNCADLARLEKLVKDHEKEVYKALLNQDKRIADLACRFNGNIQAAIAEYMRIMEQEGKLEEIISDTLLNDLYLLEKKTASIINAKEFGAVGNGICDDTTAIQNAIDHANKDGGRVVKIPKGTYLISKPIILNGCTLIGDIGNIFDGSGTVIKCLTADFTAIKQGSTSAADIMFNLQNLIVIDAAVGFEIVYAINSKFERLYAVNCATGFKLGDPSAVGSMFCEFNNLYTQGCKIGVDAHSSQYMNNNRFNNGFIAGDEYAMKLAVTGGYGAVGNVFNNVEFRSINGRGIQLTSCQNTVFNSCYMECGGNVLRMTNHCTIALNSCTYGIYKPGNTFADLNMIYAEGGGMITIDNGIIFLTDNYANRYFFGAANEAIHQNIIVLKPIFKNGSASGFDFFQKPVKEYAYKTEEQNTLTGTVTVEPGATISVPYTFATPFESIPTVHVATLRGAAGVERGLHYCFSERLATGGKISLTNTGTATRSVSFSVYAKML
jgi:hypothetical protein